MAEVEEEVRQEREQHGDNIDEEEVTKRMHAKFRSRGTESFLWCQKYYGVIIWNRFRYHLPLKFVSGIHGLSIFPSQKASMRNYDVLLLLAWTCLWKMSSNWWFKPPKRPSDVNIIQDVMRMVSTLLCFVVYCSCICRFNSSSPGHHGSYYADDNFKCIFVNENFVFLLTLHWSLFLRVQLTMTAHWFR